MMLTGFFCLLLITGGSSFNQTEPPEVQPDSNQHNEDDIVASEGTCSYQDVLNHLNLTKSTELYSMTRPVKHYKSTTRVHLQMAIYGILDVREIDQTFVLYVWIYMSWGNDHIRWNQDMFCGLKHVVVPTEVLWKPDLTIEEMTEKDKAPPSPYLTVTHHGLIELRNDLMLVSTCRMQVYKFPFDIQSCNLSFKSAVYSDDEIQFAAILNASKFTDWSREVMRIQYEWLFLNMTVHEKTVNNLSYNQSMIVYTITMKRRSVLYIANFLLPIMFFLCLDLASFLISDSGGEKLGFKVTVLLAVTVMQLILNDILPSSSDRIPLIAVYCIGMFGLMMLSLLETILVMYLMDKDSLSQDNEADKNQNLSEDCGDKLGKVVLHNYDPEVKNLTRCGCICEVSADEPPSEMLSVDREGNSRRLAEESSGLEKILCELKELEKTLNLLLNSRKEKGKPGYWTRMTKTINKVFFISYVTVACLFLVVIFTMWINAQDE